MPDRPEPTPRGIHAEILRSATAQWHRRVEQRIDVRHAFASPAAYRRLIERLLGFHAPLESLLVAHAAALPSALRPLPPRTARLADDITVLGGVPDAVAQTAALPDLDDADALLGVLYVVEGSALGGAVLARLVHQRLGLGADSGAAFFTGDSGVATQQRFATLLDLIEQAGARGRLETVVAGACDAFDRLDGWLAGDYLGGSVST